MRTNCNARDCTRGCTDTVRESALKVHSGRKIPCRTGESNQPQRRAGPTLYRQSYIPTQHFTLFVVMHRVRCRKFAHAYMYYNSSHTLGLFTQALQRNAHSNPGYHSIDRARVERVRFQSDETKYPKRQTPL